jgi:hypothetical protein
MRKNERNDPKKKRERSLRRVRELLEAPYHFHLIAGVTDPSKRLSKLLAAFVDPRMFTMLSDALRDEARKQAPDEELTTYDFSLTNPEVLHFWREVAFDLSSNNVRDEPIINAFRQADLDPVHPMSWRYLLEAFCWSHFPPKKLPGAPKQWTGDKYCQLLADIRELKGQSKTLSDRATCARLTRSTKFKTRYGALSVERLRRALREARDPKYNVDLSLLVYEKANAIFKDYKDRGLICPEEVRNAPFTKQRIAGFCDILAAHWIGKNTSA